MLDAVGFALTIGAFGRSRLAGFAGTGGVALPDSTGFSLRTGIGAAGAAVLAGMLVLGIPLMLACFAHNSDFFRGKTLTADTEVLVPDN